MSDLVTYSYGMTPAELIKARCLEQCPDGYPMTLRSQDEWSVLAQAWNQGIDSHLEALTERSTAENGEVCIHPLELHTFLRRLTEDSSDEAFSMRLGILGTLDIEEI